MSKKLLIFISLILALVLLNKFILDSQTKEGSLRTNISLEVPQLKNNPNLAKFYLWTKEDPLFTSPDFDSKAFSEAVKALELEETSYLKLQKKTQRIFPTSFLYDLPEVSLANKNFLSSPTNDSAKRLINAYKKTQNDYRKEVESFLSNLQSSKDLNPELKYVGLKSSTSVKLVIEDLKKLGENARLLDNEITARENCLRSGERCTRPMFLFKKPELNNNVFTFNRKDILPLELLLMTWMENPKESGPYIASTNCFGQGLNTQPHYLFYVFRGKEKRTFLEYDKKLDTQTEKIATEIFYRKIGQGGLDEPLNKRGYDWMRYYETNIYTCADSSYKGTLASLDKFYQSYKNDQLFEKLLGAKTVDDEASKIFKEGSVLEKRFFSSEFPSESDALTLTQYYAYTYKEIVNWDNNGKFKGKEWFKKSRLVRDEFLRRYLEYTRKLSNISEVFAETVGQLSGFRIRTMLGSLDNFNYAYSFRNMYGLTYIPFSTSFYRLAQPLVYMDLIPIFTEDERTMTYRQAISKYSAEEVKKWNVDLTKFIEEDYAKFKQNLKSTSATDK